MQLQRECKSWHDNLTPEILAFLHFCFNEKSLTVLWRRWLGIRKSIRPVKNWVVGCWHGVVICLEQGADLHMPSWCHCHSVSPASVKSRLVLPFWYPLTQVVPEKWPLNGCVCVLMKTLSQLIYSKKKFRKFNSFYCYLSPLCLTCHLKQSLIFHAQKWQK